MFKLSKMAGILHRVINFRVFHSKRRSLENQWILGLCSRGRWLSLQSDQEPCRIAGCSSLFLSSSHALSPFFCLDRSLPPFSNVHWQRTSKFHGLSKNLSLLVLCPVITTRITETQPEEGIVIDISLAKSNIEGRIFLYVHRNIASRKIVFTTESMNLKAEGSSLK